MKYAFVALFLLLTGCATTRQAGAPSEEIEVISIAPLPPLPAGSSIGGLTLDVLFHVANDGTVLDARLLKPSGDTDWDSLAIQAMKNWRFAVAGVDTPPASRWSRHKVIVQVQEPIVMTLGELVSASQREADSLYTLIKKGVDFDTLAKRSRGEESVSYCRCPGAVEIARYPRQIREALMKLRINDVTRPLRLGPNYVIYKRFSEREDAGASE